MFFRLVVVFTVLFMAYLWSNQSALNEVKKNLQQARTWANELGNSLEPWQLVFVTAGVTIFVVNFYTFVFGPSQFGLFQRAKKFLFKSFRRLPFVESKIQNKIKESLHKVEQDSFMLKADEPINSTLPVKGWTEKEILAELDRYDKIEPPGKWEEGFVSGVVYGGSQELTDLTTTVYKRYAWSNPLHPDVFPQIRKMEAEVVSMGLKIFNAGKDGVGTMTSGGTESLMLAMKTYRDIGFDRGIEFPEILTVDTAHCALDKAAHFYRMKIVRIPVDQKTFTCSASVLKHYINSNTIVIVGSAPQYPHGMIDPIEDMARLAKKYGIFMHVDCCLGGFLAPFIEKAGFAMPPFDFRVNGVTSISVDTHKYGFAPKGSSLILYANRCLRLKQFFVSIDWPGGAYATPTTAGSRAGEIIATTWATMMRFGEEGYIETTKRILTAAQKIESGLRNVPGLYVMGKPQMSVIAFSSKDFNIYCLCQKMKKKGWHLNELQFPAGVHIAVTMRHTQEGVAEKFVMDVRECVAATKNSLQNEVSNIGSLYGSTHAIPDRSIVDDIALGFLELFLKAEREAIF